MRQLSATQVHERTVEKLGLDPEALDLTAVEAISSLLRRASGFLCPCSPRRIEHVVLDSLRGVVDDTDNIRETVEATLQALIAYGDLIEIRMTAGSDATLGTQIYCAPPSFVSRRSGVVLLLGVVRERASALPEELERQVEYARHTRRLVADEGVMADMRDLGLLELPEHVWLRSPPAESPGECVRRFGRMLDIAPPSGDIPGLTLLDPTRSVRYYRGRWVEPSSQTGRFVAKRTQLYGADLWCQVEIEYGLPKKLADLPVMESGWRGYDEAWQLQAAIDAERGEPQVFRVRPQGGGRMVVQFFSPVPVWAQRRWDAIGDPVPSSGCLFAYAFDESEAGEEVTYMRDRLWLTEAT